MSKSILIFLVLKWGQRTPWRFTYCTAQFLWDTAWRTSLAGRVWPGVFQPGIDSSPVSERSAMHRRTCEDYCIPVACVDTQAAPVMLMYSTFATSHPYPLI